MRYGITLTSALLMQEVFSVIADQLMAIIIFQLLFLSIFLLLYKKGKRISNILLGLFFMMNGLSLADGYLLVNGWLIHHPHFAIWGSHGGFLIGPLIFWYTRSLLYKNFKFRRIDLLHLAPFILAVIASVFYYHIQPADAKKEILLSLYTNRPAAVNSGSVIVYLQIFAYLIVSLMLIKKYRNTIRQQFSSLQQINLDWLYFTIAGYTCIVIVAALNHFIPPPLSDYQPILLVLVIILLFIFMTYILGKALMQPTLFSGIVEYKQKYASSSLKAETLRSYKQQLIIIMEQQKVYKEPGLSIDQLSEMMQLPAKTLSQVINGEFNESFFEFVNRFRILEAQKILLDPAHHKLTILEVMYEVGFNSKSSFNTIFKKMTGKTPTAFRKSINS